MDLIDSQQKLKRERLIKELQANGDAGVKVLSAMYKVLRHKFMPKALIGDAYKNDALPIGENQTISQPTIVAKMTEALELKKFHKVLEIGTGSGYQCAVLCELARRVYTIERFKSLSDSAVKTLNSLGYNNFIPMVGDGSLGWEAQAPFDRIIATAASPEIPKSLKNQLAVGGILVIPVGKNKNSQVLIKCIKNEDGSFTEKNLGPTVFVPLIGKQGAVA